MALILRSAIPRALMIISSVSSNVSSANQDIDNRNVQYCSRILDSHEIKPFIENNLTPNYNDNDNVENILQKDYKIECCNECGTC